MKIKEKLLLSIIGVIFVFIIANPITSNAALQANGKSTKTDTIANWLLNIRKMEETGGTLGLADTINTTDLTSSASKSNNLDIHMELNTEYGAMAILSASSYGNQNKINDGETTTGNKSGVYMNINKEWVSAGSLTECTEFVNANERYKNVYAGIDTCADSYTHYLSYTAKVGDAIEETKGWHGSNSSKWLSAYCAETGSKEGLLRAYSGSIFSYYGQSLGYSHVQADAHYAKPWYSRAVVVISSGL